MKSFIMWKMPILLGGLGVALLLSPACKAQSEIAPDHFDGTDSWGAAYRAAAPKPLNTHHKPASLQSQTQQAVLTASAQSAAFSLRNAATQDTAALAEKSKISVRKPKQ